jgi:branched-chain amino acid transport system permease protein
MACTVLVLTLAIAGFFLPMALGGSAAIYSASVLIAIFAVMSYGLDPIVSDLGEVSLAQTVFFAVGAYTTALLSTGAALGPPTTLLASIAVALIIAAALGLVTLGLREFAFSLVTYAVAVVAANIAQNWSFLGGSDGLRGIPAFEVSFGASSFSARSDRELWPIAYALLLVAIYVVHAFRRSRLGTSALMTHLNPRLAVMSGVDLHRTRLKVFLFSAPITAAAGWLYAYQRAYVSADVLETYFLILMLTAVVLVGRRLLLGPLIGVSLVLIQEKFLSFGGYVDKIILGSALIISLALLPRGLVGLLQALQSGRPALRNLGNRRELSNDRDMATRP